MRLRHVSWALDEVEGFASPKIRYEQYKTPSEVASRMMHVIDSEYDDLRGKSVLDAGCGTGTLSVAASFFSPRKITGVEIDGELEEVYRRNMEKYGVSCAFAFVRGDVRGCELGRKFDTCVTNPPFGTKGNQGADLAFLDFALRHASVVYSMHKTSTRPFVLSKYKQHRARAISQMKFEIGNTYSFHSRDKVFIEVDLIRMTSSPAAPAN